MSDPVRESNLPPRVPKNNPPPKPVIPEKDKKIQAQQSRTRREESSPPSPINKRVAKSSERAPRVTEQLLGKYIDDDEKRENSLLTRKLKGDEGDSLVHHSSNFGEEDYDFLNKLKGMSEPLTDTEELKASENIQTERPRIRKTKKSGARSSSLRVGNEKKTTGNRRSQSQTSRREETNKPGTWNPGLNSIQE